MNNLAGDNPSTKKQEPNRDQGHTGKGEQNEVVEEEATESKAQ
jgi:hypothetical protein